MNLPEKIVLLRKKHNLSQEELADKLYVSRQAISRWESGSAMPEATNLLQLSRLFHVTTDYLLYDEYERADDIPQGKSGKTEAKEVDRKRIRQHTIAGTLFALAAVCYVVAVAINPDCHPLNYINILLSTFVASIQFYQRRKLLENEQDNT